MSNGCAGPGVQHLGPAPSHPVWAWQAKTPGLHTGDGETPKTPPKLPPSTPRPISLSAYPGPVPTHGPQSS